MNDASNETPSYENKSQEPSKAAAEPGAAEGPGFQAVAGEFRRNVEEAAGKLGGAAQQFVAMTASFLAAGDRLEEALEAHRRVETESRQAAESAQAAAAEARAAAEQSETAQKAAAEMLAKMDMQYGELTALVSDLQERIAALAVLARPLPREASEATEPVEAGEGLVVVHGRPRMLNTTGEMPLAANQ